MVSAVIGFYSYKFYYNNKFDSALSDSSKVSPEIWDNKYQDAAIKNSYKVVFISNNGGEYTYSEYFKYAAEKNGWQVKIFYNQILGHEQEVLDFDPDFIIFSQFSEISPDISTAINAHRSKKYLLSFSSIDALRNRFKWISMRDPYSAIGNLKKYLTMIHGVLSISPELEFYHRIFDKLNKPFNGLQVFPLVPQVINEPAEPKNLMWLSGGWDKFRSSENYRKFIKKLSENVPMKVYGHYNSSSYLASIVYGGYIPPSIDNIEAIRKNGIYLLTHSDSHFKGGEPNMRGFEAAAANAVVISDRHPFIVANFGDSFLYFDHTASSDEMYRQVKAHVDWIMANPKEAKAMAAKAHKIFLEKFTLEKDLVRIAKMHESIISQERDSFKLDYSFSY
jgi:hypothetical protein